MMDKYKYAFGVDNGTVSGRAVLVDVTDIREVVTAVHEYQDGVINENLPGTAIRLERDWAWTSTRWRPTIAKFAAIQEITHGIGWSQSLKLC